MARRTRFTRKALQSRRRRVVCGHFVTHETVVLGLIGGGIVDKICNTCHTVVGTRGLTADEKRSLFGEKDKRTLTLVK